MIVAIRVVLGIVITQAQNKRVATDQRTEEIRLAIPTPIIEPVIV